MNRIRLVCAALAAVLRLVCSLFIAISSGTIHERESSAALATGSVTVYLYRCPESESLAAGKQEAPTSPMLASCEPFDGEIAMLQLRLASGGQPILGQWLGRGVVFWPWLEFGEYTLEGLPTDSGLDGLLIATGDDVPQTARDQMTIAIPGTGIDVERRLYLFVAEPTDSSNLVDLTVEGAKS